MENNIACCLLTYMHPDIIEVYLENCLEFYDLNGADIYVIDSSPNDETEKVVGKFRFSHNNLYYHHIAPEIKANEKLLRVLRGIYLQKDYQYVFPLKDRSLFPPKTFQLIQNLATEDPHLIFLEVCEHPNKYREKKKSRYTNPVDFFDDYGWICTSWETCLFNKKMLDSLDWETLIQKFNLGNANSFTQPVSLFAALSCLKDIDIRVLHEKEVDQRGIGGVGSTWRDIIFEMWAKRWPAAINSLPSMYDDYKAKVIFDQTDIRALFGWATYMASLREQNVLNEEVWEWLRPIWPTLSSIPVEEMDCIVASDFMGAVRLMYTRLDICLENEDYKGIWKIFDQYEDMAPADLMIAIYAGLYIDECERNKGIANGIFSEVYSSQEYLERYNSMVELIKKFESDISKEEGLAAYKQLQRLHLTGESLSFIISANCENKDAVINNLESLWA